MRVGDIFGEHFCLIRQLGSGGFSEVWLAEDKRANSLKVALKIYASAQANRAEVANFIRQFELVYDIHHSNLLPPDSCGEFKGMLYLVLRYCERGSSASLAGKINETEAWNFLHDVASGLEYLHQKNIIHHDIKPDNVLITQDNTYLITDFDISAKARSTMRISADTPAGTSAYMSPERFGATPAPIRASDIWALGASLFELITEDFPFGDLGGLNQKNGANFPQIKKMISKDLKNIIMLCLQEKSWDRPTAEEIKIWCEQHFRKEKIRFEKKYIQILSGTNRVIAIDFKKVWKLAGWIGGVMAIVVITGTTAAKIFNESYKPKKETQPIEPASYIEAAQPAEVEVIPPYEDNQDMAYDTARFERAKEYAKKNYVFAQKMSDPDYYLDARNYCDSALSIKPDDIEMIELKKNIEIQLKQ